MGKKRAEKPAYLRCVSVLGKAKGFPTFKIVPLKAQNLIGLAVKFDTEIVELASW
jgi:hypothetical protein